MLKRIHYKQFSLLKSSRRLLTSTKDPNEPIDPKDIHGPIPPPPPVTATKAKKSTPSAPPASAMAGSTTPVPPASSSSVPPDAENKDSCPLNNFEGPEDPCCDPLHPLKLSFSRVSIAHHRIKTGILRTDCRRSRLLSKITGSELYLKMEVNQETGSFKERGGRFALMNLTEEERKKGVFAASAGNHALALSLHGRELGIPVNVVMPRHAPLMKISKCKQYGANVHIEGKDISVSRQLALAKARASGGKYINGYDHIDILAGAGTVGVEIMDQVPDADAVLVPCGGAGLIAGVATALHALSPATEIIGIVPETCPSLLNSLQKGEPTRTSLKATLADGLAVPVVGVNAYESVKDKITRVIAVSEQDIAVAILRLVECEKVVVEGGGAVGLAALLSGKLPELKGKKVVSIVSGGNIDSTALGKCIERGMALDGRLVRFNVIVSDRPGGVAELMTLIAKSGANVKDLVMERTFLGRHDVFSVLSKVLTETKNYEHSMEVEAELRKRYGDEAVTRKGHNCDMLES